MVNKALLAGKCALWTIKHTFPFDLAHAKFYKYHSIIQHLNSHNVLITNQHGFRSQHSCTTQLISLLEDLSYSMDHHQQTDVILLDFAKAFDSVPHQRLLLKLRHYGVNNNICHWISSWLTKRSQQVVLDGASSDPVLVQSGVPQGTVLGPLMFLFIFNFLFIK